MGYQSKIEWTDHTFNLVWGCTNVSDGCRNCYAHNLSNRYGYDIWGRNKGRRVLSDKYWQQPLIWNAIAHQQAERRRVFCSSMADVFENHQTNNEQRPKLWELIRKTPSLDWLVLTKRPENIEAMLPEDWGSGYRNVWLGTSVEDEKVITRVEILTSIPAAIHFLSLEPLIGPLPNLPLEGVEWVIVGGESGQKCRPMLEEWVLQIENQCRLANVPFFFKQWGGVNKRVTGRKLRDRYYDELPRSLVLSPE
jgi:protein gp37